MKNGRPAATEASARRRPAGKSVTSGDAWHGDNAEKLLDGLSAADAARNPVAGAHSIWQLVLHMTGWAEEVRARLLGAEAGEPTAGDWPEPLGPRADAWARTKARLMASHQALAATVRTFSDDALNAPVRDSRNRAAGTGLSRYLTVHGLVHQRWHAGIAPPGHPGAGADHPPVSTSTGGRMPDAFSCGDIVRHLMQAEQVFGLLLAGRRWPRGGMGPVADDRKWGRSVYGARAAPFSTGPATVELGTTAGRVPRAVAHPAGGKPKRRWRP